MRLVVLVLFGACAVCGLPAPPVSMPGSWSATLNVTAALSDGSVVSAIQLQYLSGSTNGATYSMTKTVSGVSSPLSNTVKVTDADGCTSFSYNDSFAGCYVACYHNTTCNNSTNGCDCGGLLDPLSIIPQMSYHGSCGTPTTPLDMFNVNVSMPGQDMSIYACMYNDTPVYMAAQYTPTTTKGLMDVPRGATPVAKTALVRDTRVYSLLLEFKAYSPYPVPVSVFQPPADCDCQ